MLRTYPCSTEEVEIVKYVLFNCSFYQEVWSNVISLLNYYPGCSDFDASKKFLTGTNQQVTINYAKFFLAVYSILHETLYMAFKF